MDNHRAKIISGLRIRSAELPSGPGVYFFKDSAGAVLYVGKAKNLKSRVSGYFQPSADLLKTRGPEIQRMIADLVEEIDFLSCDSEVDALLRESRLIKDIQPRFNERQKDGKSFPYLQITSAEDFPRVSITRQPKSKGARLFGPFVSVSELRAAVPLMQRVFKFRTCKMDISDGSGEQRYFRPCILFNISQCTAPCARKVSKENYSEQIRHLKRFLAGKGSRLRKDLAKQMKEASDAKDFERAAALRDEIRALEGLQKRGLVGRDVQPEVFYIDPAEGLGRLGEFLGIPTAPRTIEGIDIAHLSGKELCGGLVCFIDGKPFKSGYRRYKIRTHDTNDDYASIREVISRRYRGAASEEEIFPDVILIDGGRGQLSTAASAFEEMGVKPPVLLALAKKEEKIFLQGRVGAIKLSRHDPALRLLQFVRDEAHRFVQHYHHILRRKATLDEKK